MTLRPKTTKKMLTFWDFPETESEDRNPNLKHKMLQNRYFMIFWHNLSESQFSIFKYKRMWFFFDIFVIFELFKQDGVIVPPPPQKSLPV